MHHKNHWNSLFAIEQDFDYETHIQATLNLVHAEASRQNLSVKPTLTLLGLAAKQVRFLAWKIWLFQGMVLAALCSLFFLIYTVNLNSWFGSTIPKFLCGCSAVIVMSSIPILKRSSSYKMFELEQATHFAINGCVLSQLLFIGIGDLCMLAVLTAAVGIYGLTIPVTLVSLVVPFLTAAISCLMLWTRTSSASFQTLGVAFCLLASLFGYEIVDMSICLHPAAQFGLWTGYALVCIGIIYHEYRRLCLHRQIEKMLS
ncbi:MAG: hypothetical protein K2J99_03050 [Lachnospiraceae bacterium]|nr:hypothetical protein [Lachnospiraceae bacterium]